MISVRQTKESDPLEFKVTIGERGDETHHRVTLRQSDYMKLTGGRVDARRCVEAAFEFLLDHEPKESILSQFDVAVISSYFPNFEQQVKPYL